MIIFAVKSKHTTKMKAYIVTETSTDSKLILRSWVCLTEEQAKSCLQKRYDIACAYNIIGGKDKPCNCLDCDFFHWDEMNVKYNIVHATLYND